MTKLVKASTARRNADKADPAGVWISEIAERINYAASIGDYETSKWVDEDLLDEVKSTLEAAGYTVRWCTPTYIEAPLPRKLGFWRRLLEVISGIRAEVHGPCSTAEELGLLADDFVYVTVGWRKGPYPEPEEPVIL